MRFSVVQSDAECGWVPYMIVAEGGWLVTVQRLIQHLLAAVHLVLGGVHRQL